MNSVEQPGEAVYVVLWESVKVRVGQPDGAEAIPAALGPGYIAGEMSLADNLDRSANVAALEESTLPWMDREAFRAGESTRPSRGTSPVFPSEG